MDRIAVESSAQFAESYGIYLISVIPKIVVLMIIYGIFVLGTCIAIKPLMTSARKPKISLFICLILVFISFTWNMMDITTMGFNSIQISCAIIADRDEAVCEMGAPSNGYAVDVSGFQNSPGTVNLLLSDLIVVWRAWILFPHSRLCKATLIALMAINIGSGHYSQPSNEEKRGHNVMLLVEKLPEVHINPSFVNRTSEVPGLFIAVIHCFETLPISFIFIGLPKGMTPEEQQAISLSAGEAIIGAVALILTLTSYGA
ncbi:hypothetical protein BDP27DRAFT_1429620 [Rhodocollybia butyracea]|uniref:Uncharacterized protein n=1 Tax=Rhodocollybia butyracea TaxID=206335 RepID=A0A9P5PEP7_9AGAR|nr:hypothetical protein BDP27DRAFT_1429620 [Rhodocollybia butyracea]